MSVRFSGVITFTISNLQNANCYGEEGAFDFKASGGEAIDSTGFAYTINGDTYLPSSSFNGPVGVYTVVATDVNACSVSTVLTINQPTSVVLTASATNALCNAINGSLTFGATGGTGTINYTVNGVAQTSPFAAPAGIVCVAVLLDAV